MTSLENSTPGSETGTVQCQSALVTRIALFLNYLTRKNFQNLLRDVHGKKLDSEGELLKFMIAKRYINPADVPALKKTCLSFARAQEDTRFGSLCIRFEFLTQSNLNLALEEQKNLADNGSVVFLGDLLVEAGMLSDRQQKLILQKQKMDLDFKETITGFSAGAREFRERDVTIYVPEDGLSAYMVKTENFDPDLSLTELQDIIEQSGIIYGTADIKSLKTFLEAAPSPDERFELAKGLPPLPGKDARIFYLFEQDYLSAGRVNRDGSIDYKNRGEIPFVSDRDVLAEKIPARSGRDGVNVFGDVVEAEPPMDPDIICGNGVALSEDRLKAYATVQGYPKLSQDGTLSVSDAHVIRGDVDYTTGHVKFNKNVFITGVIKDGFKVEAADVVVRAVDGGTIVSHGDVAVANGITDASIKAKGSVSAGFVHRSTIACMGDMEVDKEVVESTLMLEGTFEMSAGKMYASTVSARGGARIYHIGSVKAMPSTIVVGISPYIKTELAFFNRQIEKCQNLLNNKSMEKKGLEEKLADVEKSLARLNHANGKNGFPEYLDPGEFNAAVTELRSEKHDLTAKVTTLARDLDELKNETGHWIGEKFNLKRQDQTVPPKPILDVRGRILTGTRVRGRHSSTILSRDLSRVRILEMSCAGDQGEGREIWEMVTNRL